MPGHQRYQREDRIRPYEWYASAFGSHACSGENIPDIVGFESAEFGIPVVLRILLPNSPYRAARAP
jgi:hypothetical protein